MATKVFTDLDKFDEFIDDFIRGDHEMSVEVRFGALSDPIAKQLKDGGFKAKESKSVQIWQADADAITRLLMRGLISPSIADTARKRLIKTIGKGIIQTQTSEGE